MLLIAIVAAAVLCGTILQRLSGTGVGLIVSPVFALALGPAHGVLLSNATTTMSGLILTIAVWRQVSWRRWGLICSAAILGVVPGAFLVHSLRAAWLQVIVGATVTLALVVTLTLTRLPAAPVRSGALVAGATGGLLNVTAGVAAPAMVIYSRMSRWDQREYGATMQPVFMTMGILSLVTKSLLGLGKGSSFPSPVLIPVAIGAILIGTLIGSRLARLVTAQAARRMALALAGAGGVATLLRGVLTLIG